MATSASRCLFWVSSQVLSAMPSKFSTWTSAINSSIFGDSNWTLTVSTFSRVLGCISQPVFVGGGLCGTWSAVDCWCPWQSLSFLLVAVVGTVDDHPCWLLSFLFIMVGFVVCVHPWILWIIIDLFLFCPSKLVSSSSMNHLLLLYCPIDSVCSLFFRIQKQEHGWLWWMRER